MDCENCNLRKVMAIAFDLHWMGEDDCPMSCEQAEAFDEDTRNAMEGGRIIETEVKE